MRNIIVGSLEVQMNYLFVLLQKKLPNAIYFKQNGIFRRVVYNFISYTDELELYFYDKSI